MLHASELRFVHPVSHEPMHIQQASRFDRPRRESPGLPHQIVGHLKVGVRIVFILLILTQGAVQHDAAGVALGNFLSHYRRNNRIFTFGLVIHRRAIARRPLISWVWVGLSTMIFDQIIIGKVKADIAPGDRNAVHLDQLLYGLYTLSPAPPAFAAR